MAGMMPEEQEIVTGAVLVMTLVIFGLSGTMRQALRGLVRRHAR
jgi:hypothetical protein